MTSSVIEKLKAEATDAPEVTISLDRYGYKINGEFYRRVTTCLQGIPKPWLATWAAKEVAEFAIEHRDQWAELPKTDAAKLLKGAPWSKRDDAGDRGTAVHKAMEAVVRRKPLPELANDDERACAASAMAFLGARGSTPLASELTVFSPGHGYAGTLDLWDVLDGETWILDWKTSSGVYAEHAVQLAAYRNAQFAVVNKKPALGTGTTQRWTGRMVPWGPERADRLGIVHVTPEAATLYPILYTERLWDVFRAALFMKKWQSDTDDYAGKTPKEPVFDKPIPTAVTTEVKKESAVA